MNRWILAAALIAAGCPRQLSLECRPCEADSECAPQGFACRGGFCEGATACVAPPGEVPDASVVFEDDFERRVLVAPDAGRWDSFQGPTQDQVLGLTDGGLHGAALSLRDNGTTNGQFGRFIEKQLALTNTDLHVRTWLWLDANGGWTGPHAVVVYSDDVPASTLAEALMRDRQVKAKCADAARQSETCGGPGEYRESSWHLFELSMEGLGTASGRCVLRVDGVELCAMPRDYTAVTTDALAVGATSMDPAWTGELRADNLAVTAGGRPPGQLTLVPPRTGLTAGFCSPVRLELHTDADAGTLARAVRPLHLSLEAGGGAFHAPGCRGAALQELRLDAGTPFVTLGFRPPDAAQVSVSVIDRSNDLAPATGTWPIAP